jgi:hypothetical protein
MALQSMHDYSAKGLRAQMAAGKFKKLRWFQFEGMRNPPPSSANSGTAYAPTWTRQTGSQAYAVPK